MIVAETLGRRWYAFGFVAMLVWAAAPHGGPRRALRFLAVAAVLSFAAEYASTHGSLPYGRYDYTAHTRLDELYLSNVPLFVPISFGTVVWAGRALAARVLGATAGWRLVGGGAVFAAAIDLVIDPMTLRGDGWFLGEVYRYRHGGFWFDVPWSNHAGWVFVAAAILAIDRLLGRRDPAPREGRGITLAFTIMLFFVVVAVATGEWAIAGASGAITAALGALCATGAGRESRAATR